MQASTITFVHVPAFDPEATARHGGVRRATQVAALARADLNCPIPARRAVPFARALRYTVIGLKELTSLPSPLRSMLKAAFAIGFLKDQLSQMRAAPETAMILVELVRGPTTYLGYWLAKKGYRFAVAPQNMEFLVPSKASRGEMDVWQYRMERSIYRAASCVLCISDFDAKIVRCLSARAVTLPYYPWKGDIRAINSVNISSIAL